MGVPVQVIPLLVKDATTLKVAVIGVTPAFVAVNPGIFPVPEFGPNPIGSLVRLQENTAPGTSLEKTIEGTEEPAQ